MKSTYNNISVFEQPRIKLAVMSDIHSNYYALKACLDDAICNGAEGFVFLGDYVSDLAMPIEVMDLVYSIADKYPTFCLRGNRERYLLDCKNGKNSFSRGLRTGSLAYTYDKLRDLDIDFFEKIPFSGTFKIGNIDIEAAHSMMDCDRRYFDAEDGGVDEAFKKMRTKIFLTGHSHRQFILENDGKRIVNPGSVGLSHGSKNTAKYSLLTVNEDVVDIELCSAEYDIAATIRSQFSSGLAEYAKYWASGVLYDVITGDRWVVPLLELVDRIGDIDDETAWQRGADIMGIKLSEPEIFDFFYSHANRENRI